MSYPYDSSTKDFIKTIDSLRLPPDFVELLEEVPCVYYDGCLVVEVRDFRGSSTAGLTGAPVVRRVLLQPDTETIVSDVEQICAEHADWTSDDCLKIEQSIVVLSSFRHSNFMKCPKSFYSPPPIIAGNSPSTLFGTGCEGDNGCQCA